MSIVPGARTTPTPTRLEALPPLLAYTRELGLERHLDRPNRGAPTLRLGLAWPAPSRRPSAPRPRQRSRRRHSRAIARYLLPWRSDVVILRGLPATVAGAMVLLALLRPLLGS